MDYLGTLTLPPINAMLTELDNDLAAASTPLILILDDYHVIDAAAIHQTLQFLLDHAPPTFHLALLARADPPLSLSRWRARHQINEIRVDDLRFNREETRDFLAGTMGLDIEPAAVDALQKRTEGWAVRIGIHQRSKK